VAYEYVAEALVGGVEPAEGPEEGGTVVSVVGVGLAQAESVGCRFGSIAPVSGRWVSEGSVQCATPAARAGRVAVEATTNGADYTRSEVSYAYSGAGAVEAVAPAAGPVGGGTEVLLVGEGSASGTDVRCRFGLEVVRGSVVGGGRVCAWASNAVPPAAVAGDFYGQATTSLGLGAGAQGGLYGLAGVLGGAWRSEERCVGWSEVACTAPAHGAGVVSVEVSWAHGSFSRSGVEFEFRAEASVGSVLPTGGPASGGSVVVVEGSHLSEEGLLCRFGGGLPATAQFVSSAVARCEAASHGAGAVAVEGSVGDEG
jgi:hypothetical protein